MYFPFLNLSTRSQVVSTNHIFMQVILFPIISLEVYTGSELSLFSSKSSTRGILPLVGPQGDDVGPHAIDQVGSIYSPDRELIDPVRCQVGVLYLV